ncbi:hypothetical protein CMQ_7222 [Grosmannia clavigera kw1407]|uniref:LrgB-like protein n=1 Tax=Grosmannia clavigera (strain kw1407 / UAMH 11150) TaxID=655863 RepID=F0XQE7_GROCL|nr:uncharacterized protein CMQ_7222 [Grosmannia clavigera kw1407]EFX00220.1 hypothetical protein CMQ_7222 [Grosmannia clavigera kw1407]
MMMFAAYMTRAIQLLLSSPRKSPDHAVGDDGREREELTPLRLSGESPHTSLPPMPPRSHAAAYITVRGQNLDDPLSSFSDVPVPHFRISIPVRPPRPRAERWAEFVGGHADTFLFFCVLLLAGLPSYYSSPGYTMPLHLSVNILMFFSAMALPPSWRQLLHPVIVSAFSTLLIVWLLGRVHGDNSLSSVLGDYRTGSTYLKLWAAAGTEKANTLPRPGAGDILSSAMDASIVSLALPMYQYRHELRRHFFAIVLPNIVLSIISLFVYPVVCHAIGISPERSLAFTSRSLTLALATPAVKNLGGDLNTVSAVALISGVLGVLIGRQLLSWLRIPEDDYITRGVTFGANASALGTALLLRTDPRAAAISSLAMGLFGTVTVVFSSIPPMVHIIRSLVGLT